MMLLLVSSNASAGDQGKFLFHLDERSRFNLERIFVDIQVGLFQWIIRLFLTCASYGTNASAGIMPILVALASKIWHKKI